MSPKNSSDYRDVFHWGRLCGETTIDISLYTSLLVDLPSYSSLWSLDKNTDSQGGPRHPQKRGYSGKGPKPSDGPLLKTVAPQCHHQPFNILPLYSINLLHYIGESNVIRTCNLRLCLCHFARLHRSNSWVPPSSALHTVLTDTLATTWFTTIMSVTTPATKSGSACTTNPKDDLTHLVLSHRPLVGKGPLTIHPTTKKREVTGYTGDGWIHEICSDTRESF